MCVLLLAACAKSQHTVAYDGTTLSVDARPVQVSAIRFHYWQWPSPDSWPAALREVHSRGFNTIALDLFWGHHSARPGSYDFTGIRDIGTLLDDAASEGLYVAVDAGPYTDSGADAGGLPDWILAHTASRATLKARYLRESREWLSKVDAILRRHQINRGNGTVVLYHSNGGALANAASFERAVRRDGIAVPFGALHPPGTFPGFAWGWTTAPSVVASGTSGSNRTSAADAGAPVAVTTWRSRRDDLEILPGFEDQAWPPLLAAGQFDADDNDDDAAPAKANGDDEDDENAPPARFFGVDDYGFHHGSVWYRGHFDASGNERHFTLSGVTGASGACTVWLNGTYLGSLVAGRDGSV
ncbi:MAG TPA: beta-galactosidase, partial [Candidatus Tumulicola sp.]